MKPVPPRWPARLLKLLCDPELVDEIEGDLLEMFHKWVSSEGISKARWKYVLHTVKFIRPFIFKRRKAMKNYPTSDFGLMYIKSSWRNIIRKRTFAAINVAGLALSFTCVIFIYALCAFHLRIDNFHQDADRIYRVTTTASIGGGVIWPVVPQPLGKAIRNDLSAAEIAARIRYYRNVTVVLPEIDGAPRFDETGTVAFTEPEYFRIFSYDGVSEKVKAQLKDPNTVIITRMIAKKYFGEGEALDQTIRVVFGDRQVDFRVVGVLNDPPANTDLRAQIFLSYENLKDYNAYYASDKSWGSVNGGMYCFLKLKQGVAPSEMDASFHELVKKYYNEEDAQIYGFRLQPLADVHMDVELGGSFSWKYVWILVAIGTFLIVIAAVNFVNLASAQVLTRAREAGIRKVLGSHRAQLYLQFLIETSMIGLLALIIAIGTAYACEPLFNGLLIRNLAVGKIDYVEVSAFVACVDLLVVIVAGSYPALLMSGFQPIVVLKGKLLTANVSGISLRRVLIVAQFTIAQMLIIGMIVIGEQVRYSITTDLGFDKEAIVLFPIPRPDLVKMRTLNAQLTQVSGVRETSLCFEPPASQSNTLTSVVYDNRDKEEPWEINLKEGDDHYVTTFGLQLVAGRNLLPADSAREFLVNETFVSRIGVSDPADVIGRGIATNGKTVRGTIVGVVRDFNNQSLHNQITPICIVSSRERFRTLAAKLNTAASSDVIAHFRDLWTKAYPEFIFSYQFFDERIAQFYETEASMLRLVEGFAIIAIAISCLGLYGLVSFMAVQRTKEISVRKVLGANVPGILWLFGKEFALLITCSFVIAAPVAGWFMDKWLQAFAYHVPLGSFSFLFALTGTLIVAIITVSYHSVRAATANPVDALRSE